MSTAERQTVVPRIDILRKGEVVRAVPLTRTRLVLGSEEGADLRLKHPAIAVRHLLLEIVQGRYVEAENLAGEGRVLLAGQPVTRARLREGDEVDLGPVVLRLVFERKKLATKAASQEDEPTDADRKAPVMDEHAPLTIQTVTGMPALSEAALAQAAPQGAAARGSAAVAAWSGAAPAPAPSPSAPAPSARPTATAVGQPQARSALTLGSSAFTPMEAPRTEASRPDPARPPGQRPLGLALPGARVAPTSPLDAPAAPAFVPPPPPQPVVDDRGEDVDLDDTVLDPVPVVVIEPPGGQIQRVPLRVGTFVVGSGRCAFRLSYPTVAPAHAEVMVMPDGVVYLKHLAAAGLVTLRNGSPIQFSRWSAGDRVQVGPVSLVLDLVSRDAAPEAPAPSSPASSPRIASVSPPSASRLAAVGPATSSSRLPAAPVTRAPPSASAPAEPPLEPKPSQKDAPKVRVRAGGARPAAPTHDVQISLDVRAADTYAAHAWDEQPADAGSLLGRAFGPLVAITLLGVIGVQGWVLLTRDENAAPPVTTEGPRTATGSAQAPGPKTSAWDGQGSFRVGDPKGRTRTGLSRPATDGAGGDGGEDQWVDAGLREQGIAPRLAGGTTSPQPSPGSAAVRAPSDALVEPMQREEEPEAPSESGSGQGFVEMKLVEKAIYDNNRLLRGCFEQAKQDDKRLGGTLWLTMTLGIDGRVRGAIREGRSTIENASMQQCIERRLSTIRFPEPEGGAVTFSYPFEFR